MADEPLRRYAGRTGASAHLSARRLQPLRHFSRGPSTLRRGSERWEVLGRFPGDEHEHGYKWLDATVPLDLSADGKTLLFAEKEPG